MTITQCRATWIRLNFRILLMTAPRQRLLTPGPTAVPKAVLREMALPMIHHRTAEFRAIFAELTERLGRLFGTVHPVLCITGSGTTAFEAAQVSLAVVGSTVITASGGKFGERWQDIYDIYAPALEIKNVKIAVPWGRPVDPTLLQQTLEAHPDTSVVTVVHSETSTATASDLRRIAEIVHRSDALLVADGITAVGALPLEMDEWGIDVVITGSQKALMLPPGLGYVGLGPRALQRLEQQKPRGSYNLDLRRWLASWHDQDVPFTPPVSLIRAQRVALEMIESEGLANVQKRTVALAAATRAALKAMGLKLISVSPSDSLTGAYYPAGVADGPFRKALRQNHSIHIAGGQKGRGADWSGKIFRISHMGYIDATDTCAALEAIETELIAAGAPIKAGTALDAANATLGK